MTDVTTQPSTSGVSARPASTAVPPSPSCTRSGTYEMALNMAAPTISPMPAMDATIRSASRSSGTIGSGARRSTRTSHHPNPVAAP